MAIGDLGTGVIPRIRSEIIGKLKLLKIERTTLQMPQIDADDARNVVVVGATKLACIRQLLFFRTAFAAAKSGLKILMIRVSPQSRKKKRILVSYFSDG